MQAAGGDQHVAGVLAGRHGRDDQPGGGRGGQVLEGVDGEVALAAQQRLAQRGDEHAGAAHLRDRAAVDVAARDDPVQRDLGAERAQGVGDVAGLGQREPDPRVPSSSGPHCSSRVMPVARTAAGAVRSRPNSSCSASA